MIWEAIKWCDAADAALHDLIDPAIKSVLLREIEAGEADLFRISGADFETFLITRLDCFEDGSSELVLEAIRGRYCREIVEQVKAGAKSQGVETLRYTTQHPDKVARRLVGPVGFERAETTYRVTL